MYKQDQKAVQEWVNTPDRLHEMITMVVLSYRQPWFKIGDELTDVRENGERSRFLFSFKRDAFKQSHLSRERLFEHATAVRNGASPGSYMLELTKVKGIGLAKAGFILQLSCGLGGCLDSHNVRRFGINTSVLRLSANERKRRDSILRYLDLCNTLGGSEYLWDSWCELIYERQRKWWMCAEQVSAAHYGFLANDLEYTPWME